MYCAASLCCVMSAAGCCGLVLSSCLSAATPIHVPAANEPVWQLPDRQLPFGCVVEGLPDRSGAGGRVRVCGSWSGRMDALVRQLQRAVGDVGLLEQVVNGGTGQLAVLSLLLPSLPCACGLAQACRPAAHWPA